MAGIHLRFHQRPFVLIEQPVQTASRIYFEASSNGIGALAFATDAPKRHNLVFQMPQPSPHDVLLHIDNYFFTSCSLDGLEEITPCLPRDGSPGLTGLILHFPDGRRGSVGQVRLDCIGESFTVSEAPLWFLAFGKWPGGCPYVLEAGIGRPVVDGHVQHVMELSRTGKLEWIWPEPTSRRQE